MKLNINYLKSSFGENLAYSHEENGSKTSVFFFGGYASDMTGTKATALSNGVRKIIITLLDLIILDMVNLKEILKMEVLQNGVQRQLRS